MSTKKIIGLVGFTDKGAWVSGYSSTVDGVKYTGYDQNDIVYTDNGVFKSNKDSNTTNPDTDTTGAWSKWLDNTITAVAEATKAANNVNAELNGTTFKVTDRTGASKTLSLADASEVGEITENAKRCSLALGHYSDRDDITLTATETGKAISSDGVKVSKSGWAIAEFTAEKGNEYLFKPGVTDGNVCVFAEYIDKIETRAIDYTYTYNTDGTIATATATYGGKTYKYTYTYDTSGAATITDASGNNVSSIPLTYTTTVGTYSPLVRLNADAELPTDGYCRYMSHFQGNSSIKVVVSYKIGSADLTMKVLRDGVFASISTQLGNLSQKLGDLSDKVVGYHGNSVEVMYRPNGKGTATTNPTVQVDGKSISVEYGKKYKFYPTKKIVFIGNGYGYYGMAWAKIGNLDTSGFTSMENMFQTRSVNPIRNLDVSNFDTSAVTNMGNMFLGCSALTSLDVSGWDTSAVTNMSSMFWNCSALTSLDVSGWDTSAVTNMGSMFWNCSALTSLDVSGWDTSAVTNMSGMFLGCSALTSLDVSGMVTSACTDLSQMFGTCLKLQTLDTSGWDTSAVTNMGNFAYNAGQLKSIDLSSWNVAKCTNFSRFLESRNLTTLIGSHTLAEVESGDIVALEGLCLDFSLSIATSLDRKSLLAVIKGLATVSGKTLTLGTTLQTKLTSDDIAIATGKGWTIA